MRFNEAVPHIDALLLENTPIERAETIPSQWYVDEAFLPFDQRSVFEPYWQYAGHECQLPECGDYLNVRIGRESVVVVRDNNGAIQAFFNVCRHRGGPLVMDDCGHTKMLQCKYHGWTYTLEGSLRGVPRFNRVDLFDKKDFGLRGIDVATWQGLIFVRIQCEQGDPLDHALAGIAERIAPQRLDQLQFYRRVPYEIQCNWKVYVDNYLEGYHLPFVHPELCDVLDYGEYITETYPTYSLQYSPIRERETPYGAPGGAAYYYFIFPNIMLNILPGRLQTNVVIPLTADRTLVLFDYFFADIDTEEAIQQIQADMQFSDRVQEEDVEICEHVQRGLSSQAYDRGRFSVECEQGVYHFHTLLKSAYRAAVQPAETKT